MKIYLYNLAINTNNDQFHIDFNVDQKLALIGEKLNEINTVLTGPDYADTTDLPFRAIFVAPEYFFARGFPEHYLWRGENIPDGRKGRHYEYEAYEAIRRGLTYLSRYFPKILLVPGTVAWKRPAVPRMADPIPGTSRYAPVPSWPAGSRKNKAEYFVWMEALGETPTESSWSDYNQEAPDRLILEADSLLRQDAGELYGGHGLSAEDKRYIVGTREIDPEAYIEELRKLEFGLAYNTAYFYLGGKKVGEYSKHSDYQEVLLDAAYEKLSVALLTRESSILDIAGLKFGVEICLDHACDTLKTYLSRSKIFFTVGDFDSGDYCLRCWTKGESEQIECFLKDSSDAYYRYRSFDGTVNKLYYFCRKDGPLDISDQITSFDLCIGVTYDGATLHINGHIRAAGGGSASQVLTEEDSRGLSQLLNIDRNYKPDIHLILSASVSNKLPQAKYCWIHSSSQHECNLPKLPYANPSFSGELSTISPHISRELFNAASRGNIALVWFLICLGADVNSQHTDKRLQSTGDTYFYRGKTPLFIAAEMGHHEVVKLLIDNGANPKIRDAGFWRPYDVALVMEHQYGRKECSPCVLTLQGIS